VERSENRDLFLLPPIGCLHASENKLSHEWDREQTPPLAVPPTRSAVWVPEAARPQRARLFAQAAYSPYSVTWTTNRPRPAVSIAFRNSALMRVWCPAPVADPSEYVVVQPNRDGSFVAGRTCRRQPYSSRVSTEYREIDIFVLHLFKGADYLSLRFRELRHSLSFPACRSSGRDNANHCLRVHFLIGMDNQHNGRTPDQAKRLPSLPVLNDAVVQTR